MPTPFSRDDAASLTEVSDREASEAWHTARDDCQESGDYGSRDWDRGDDDDDDEDDEDE